jgi:hypothetical protein
MQWQTNGVYKMATLEDVKLIIIYLMQAYSNYHPDTSSRPSTADVLYDLLGDLDAATLTAAVKTCCSESRAFAPSAGEIRGAAVMLQAQASGIPTAGEAWGAIVGSFERMPGGNMLAGGHGPILDHPLVLEAVTEFGGYSAFDNDNQMADRAHFIKLYEALYHRELARAAQPPAVREYVARLSISQAALECGFGKDE